MAKTKIGIVGIGSISGIYLTNITKLFRDIEIAAVCDLIKERAENAVKNYGIPKLYDTMYELFADPEIDIVLNLTRPYQHYEVSRAALEAGKHVYSEKPLGATLEEGEKLVKLALEKGLLIGGAPDTFMGAGIQTARQIIDSGEIGDVVAATANMICHGHETWHPDPEFYYKHGGGPLFDMGPYYITALINLIGGVKKVSGMAAISFPRRTITSQPHNGDIIEVDVPTNINGLIRFDNGATASLFTTFDCYPMSRLPNIEIYGSKGTISVPDPNCFGGEVKVQVAGQEPKVYPLAFAYEDNSRALGLADMANALRDNRPARCSYEQTLHVLEIMCGILESSRVGHEIEIQSHYERKKPMVVPETVGVLD